MFTRTLGKSGIQVSALGLGCWAIGGDAWGKVDDNESIRAIRRGLDLGITFLDTADVYGLGHSEKLLNKALQGKRHEVVIATKFGNTFNEETGDRLGPDGSPDYLFKACEASLRRLGVETIDLYQFHAGNYELDQAEATLEALEELVQAGKIRYYGWSTDSPERARFFAQRNHCTAIQQRLNIFEGDPDTLAVCEAFNLASINRGPLAMGLLTGKYSASSSLPNDDIRAWGMPWIRSFVDGKPNPEWLARLESIRDALTSEGHTLTQGALAWIWARSPQTIPIPGFKNVAQVEENAGALQKGPLSADLLRQIEALLL